MRIESYGYTKIRQHLTHRINATHDKAFNKTRANTTHDTLLGMF